MQDEKEDRKRGLHKEPAVPLQRGKRHPGNYKTAGSIYANKKKDERRFGRGGGALKLGTGKKRDPSKALRSKKGESRKEGKMSRSHADAGFRNCRAYGRRYCSGASP